jgi:glycosyltransferase involved in cell wall biosynthesis
MGAGRPVLFYDTPENREVVADAGRPFRFGGPRALSGLIEEIIDDEKALVALAERARRRTADRYAWSRVAAAYAEVLEDLC